MSKHEGYTPYEISKEKGLEIFIGMKTVPTTPARILTGTYRGYVTTLRARLANTGNIYIGRNEEDCVYPLMPNSSQITKVDIGKLWYYSDNGTEKLYIWMEIENPIYERPPVIRPTPMPKPEPLRTKEPWYRPLIMRR